MRWWCRLLCSWLDCIVLADRNNTPSSHYPDSEPTSFCCYPLMLRSLHGEAARDNVMTEYCFCQLALYNPVKNKADGIIISSKFIFSCHDVARLALTITHSLINYQRGRVGTLVTGSILPHCCDCLKPGPGLPTTCHSYVWLYSAS
jgi:hypothetical protein